MKAAVYYGKGDIRVESRPVRRPGAGEVLVRVACCGVCGTDLHIYHGDAGAAETVPPRVLGHEFSGVVRQVGPGVDFLAEGDHVSVDPNTYCGHCHYCRGGNEHLCAGMSGIGTTRDGGFAQYCTLPAAAALRVPKEMPLEVAAFGEPLGCCLHGMDLTGVRLGDSVLVIGGGTIGLLMLQLARAAGAARLALIEPDEQKRGLGARFGADLCFASGAGYLAYAESGPDVRADRVIECVGKTETVELAIEAASKGATVMLFGLTPPQARVAIRPFDLFRRELHITASFVNPRANARALELLAGGRVEVRPLISLTVPLERLAEVLENPEYRRLAKILVKP